MYGSYQTYLTQYHIPFENVLRYSQNFPHGKIGLKQVIDTITHPMLNTSTQPLKVVQKTELKFALMCKIRAPKLYWADIATSENINT